MTLLQQCRVVLVRTRFPGNLGSTARVMRNLGVHDLVLVAPEADPSDPQARQLSTHGEAILDSARTVCDLRAALDGTVLVVGTSARTGGLFRRQSVRTPREFAESVVPYSSPGLVALVFGPEPSGLTDEEVACCNYLISIPADPGYPALNLSHAVAVCLYELRMASDRLAGVQETSDRTVAPLEVQDRAFDHIREALTAIHFLHGEKADALMHALRHLIGRAGPSAMEVGVLHGLARQILWFAERHSDA